MQVTLMPQRRILTIWRVTLTAGALVPAFLCSLFFHPGSTSWWIISLCWLLIFLFFYLVYLPARFRKLSLQIDEDRFVRTSGVFYHSTRTVPLGNIQFLRVRSSPLHRYFDLATLIIVAPGGSISMPGLKQEEANRLIAVLL